MHRTVDKKLSNDVLIREDFKKPQAKLDIVHESLSDHLNKLRNRGSCLGSESDREHEANQELEHFKLISFLGLMNDH